MDPDNEKPATLPEFDSFINQNSQDEETLKFEDDEETLKGPTKLTPSTKSGKEVQKMLGAKDSSHPFANVVKNTDIQAGLEETRKPSKN